MDCVHFCKLSKAALLNFHLFLFYVSSIIFSPFYYIIDDDDIWLLHTFYQAEDACCYIFLERRNDRSRKLAAASFFEQHRQSDGATLAAASISDCSEQRNSFLLLLLPHPLSIVVDCTLAAALHPITNGRSDAGPRLLLHSFEHNGYLNLNNQRTWHIWYLSSVLLHFASLLASPACSLYYYTSSQSILFSQSSSLSLSLRITVSSLLFLSLQQLFLLIVPLSLFLTFFVFYLFYRFSLFLTPFHHYWHYSIL